MRRRLFLKRFLHTFFMITLPILLIFLLYFGKTYYEQRAELQNNVYQNTSAIRDNYHLVLDTASMQYDILTSSPRLSIALRNYASNSTFSYIDVILTNNILANFVSLTSNNAYISSVYYYLSGYNNMLSSADGMVQFDDFYDNSWLSSYEQSGSDEWLEIRTISRNSYTTPSRVLTLYKKLHMFRGVVLINIDVELFSQLLRQQNVLGQFFITNRNSDFVLTGGESQSFWETHQQKLLDCYYTHTAEKNTPHSQWLRLNHTLYFVNYMPADYDSLVISCTSMSDFYRPLMNQLMQLLFIIAIILLATLWSTYTLTRKNFRQIDYLVEIFSNAEKGIYNEKNPAFSMDEYDLILNNLVNLFVNQTFLKNQLALKEEKQRIAEFTALQLQINPHFLFNTLQTIDFKALELTKQPTAVNQMIGALSDLLKYSLENPNTMVLLKDEIAYLKKYDLIQHFRYEDKYILYYEYEDELLELPMMRLILQPLIENSLYHGIKPLNGMGYLKLKILKKGSYVYFSVLDNGVGMTKEEVARLYQMMQNPDSRNIGMTNVNSRLVMRYGTDAALRILSKKGLGSCISFRIPLSEADAPAWHASSKA